MPFLEQRLGCIGRLTERGSTMDGRDGSSAGAGMVNLYLECPFEDKMLSPSRSESSSVISLGPLENGVTSRLSVVLCSWQVGNSTVAVAIPGEQKSMLLGPGIASSLACMLFCLYVGSLSKLQGNW